MKKAISLIFAAIPLFSLCGCSQGKSSSGAGVADYAGSSSLAICLLVKRRR